MFPATKHLFRPLLLASLMLVLGQAPAFAQRRMMPMWMTPQMLPTSMSAMPSFGGLNGNGAMTFSAGSGNFSTSPSGNPLSAYGLGYGGLGYGGYGLGYGGYGSYGQGYGMAQTGSYGIPSSAAYADPPGYYSRSSDSSSDLETALRDASSKSDKLSNTEKVANLRKRLDKYLYLTNEGESKNR